MKYLPVTEADRELIEAAKAVIRNNYVAGRHHVGAAVRGMSGQVYAGVHLESHAIDICAEAVALGTAASNGEREFRGIVAVTMAGGKEPRIISPCGVCRELIRFYGNDIEVLFMERDELRKCRIDDLLPAAYIDS
ncbi:MAG: cytidine deaminase [candidate division Zixibacteria bacterium]|nr:cytidine deaminase [candidate division Zixibacteria bacterium]